MKIQDQYNNQYLREANYCGRFKAWQMALIFIVGVLVLFASLPVLTYLLGMTWTR